MVGYAYGLHSATCGRRSESRPYNRHFRCVISIYNIPQSDIDIFGFENFAVNGSVAWICRWFDCNSFDQLCINLANEQLHDYFNQVNSLPLSRKLTIIAYFQRRDGSIRCRRAGYHRRRVILHVWVFKSLRSLDSIITKWFWSCFSDISWACSISLRNRLFLKQASTVSLFDILRMIGNDAALIQSFNQNLESNDLYDIFKDGITFQINHFAAPIAYNSSGFVTKNKDPLPNQVFAL